MTSPIELCVRLDPCRAAVRDSLRGGESLALSAQMDTQVGRLLSWPWSPPFPTDCKSLLNDACKVAFWIVRHLHKFQHAIEAGGFQHL